MNITETDDRIVISQSYEYQLIFFKTPRGLNRCLNHLKYEYAIEDEDKVRKELKGEIYRIASKLNEIVTRIYQEVGING